MRIETTAIDTATYEQPLNESMRICLRLEHLFTQLNKNITDPRLDSSRISLTAILKILDVISRPDLKSKLTRSLAQYATTLTSLEQLPQVDPARLSEILENLDQLITSLHNNQSQLGAKLRKNEFLNQIRLSLGNPGGACAFSNPAYALWLRKPSQERAKDLQSWSSELKELGDVIEIILNLARNSSPSEKLVAEKGFYYQNLNPSLPYEMIRVHLATELCVFPEFSVGRHRLTIRFLTPNYHDKGRPEQLQENIDFELTCCRV